MQNVFYLIILCITFTVSSQENDTIKKSIFSKKHELRIDPVKFAIHRRLGLSYEYFYNKRISFGISGIFLTDPKSLNEYKNDPDLNKRDFLNKYQIIPNIRYSLGFTKKSLYYVEIYSSINSGIFKELSRVSVNNIAYYDILDKKYVNFAIGGSIGWKRYFKNGFLFDVFAGLAPNIEVSKGADLIPRIGINIGYRF